MDHYKVSATATDRRGNEGSLSIKVSERSSEVISRDEMAIMLMHAAQRAKVRLTGPMLVEQIDPKDTP